MEIYVQIALYLLIPMSLGALALMIMVLTKGDICPGQRGRLHKQLPVLSALMMVSIAAVPALSVPAGLMVYFNIRVKTGKTRDQGPVQMLFAALGLGLVVWLYALSSLNSVSVLGSVMLGVAQCCLLGAALTHLLMLRARTRLQAFHTLLPVGGVGAAMLLTVVLLAQSGMAWSQQSEFVTKILITALPMLLLGAVIWCWHLLRSVEVTKVQLWSALVLVLSSSYSLLVLF